MEPTLGWTLLSRDALRRAETQLRDEVQGVRDEIGFLAVHQAYPIISRYVRKIRALCLVPTKNTVRLILQRLTSLGKIGASGQHARFLGAAKI